MTRRGAVAGLMLAAVTLSAQGADSWDHWQYAAPITTPAPAGSRLVGVVVPAAVTAKARPEWEDLRVVDGQNVEQPFVLWSGASTLTREWRNVRLLDPGFVAGGYSQVVLDLGERPAVHNRLRLDLSATMDYQTWIEVAVSGDARTWQVVRDRAPIYDLSRAGIGDKREASYPPSVSRYVRVRLLDGVTRFNIAGAAVAEETESKLELLPTDLVFAPSAVGDRRSGWVSQGGADGLTIAEIRIETTQAQFLRPLAVEASDDGTTWRRVASGEIARTRVQSETRETLSVPVWAPPAKHWRVVVYDQNDRPLTGVALHAFVRPRRVVFQESPGQTYRLLFGHSRAAAPSYDLGRLTGAAALDAAAPATLGAIEINPRYADPAPWTERHPVVLWGAVVIGVLVLGAIAVRALRGGQSSGVAS